MREMKDSGIEWIGSIPNEWKIKRIKELFYEVNERSEKNDDYQLLSVSEYYGVAPKTEKVDEGDFLTHADSLEGYKICKPDDIVMNIMLAWKRALGVSRYEGIISPAYCIYRKRTNEIDTGYYHYLYRTDLYAGLFKQYSTGIIDSRLRLYPDKFLSLKCQMPELKEQKRMVEYLDSKCAQIDSIIAKQEQIIEKLKEYKLSVITEAVTKGLNPDVEMKDSGVDWIGLMPKEWGHSSVGRIANVVRGASPRPAGDPLYFNGQDVPWITVAEVTNGEGKYIDSTETYLTIEGSKKSRIVEEGTLLLSNSGATLGVPKITRIKGCINDGSLAFYNLSINQDYLLYVFRGRTFELRKQMQGYGQPNLNTTIVKEIEIPLPTEEEQIDIASYLDEKCASIEKTIKDRQTAIEKLQDYKKSLIYEVVTGKKEV